MHFKRTSDGDTLAVIRRRALATTTTHLQVIRPCRVLTDHPLQWTQYRARRCDGLSYASFKASNYCKLPTALKRPDRSKQCHFRQFAQNEYKYTASIFEEFVLLLFSVIAIPIKYFCVIAI